MTELKLFLFIVTLVFISTVTSFHLSHRTDLNVHSFKTKTNIIIRKALENDGDVNNDGFTRKQLLREETENPFRNVRYFLYFSLISAAAIGIIR